MGISGHFVCFMKVKHTCSRCVIRLKSEVSFVGTTFTGAIACRLYGMKGNTPKGEVESSPEWGEV